MEKINRGVVFSNDIDLIMQGKNSLKFNYLENGLIVPDKSFINDLRDDFKEEAKKAYEADVTIVSEEEMAYYMNQFVNNYKGLIPIVSMDEIYIDCDEKNIFALDCTRMTGQKKLVSRLNPLDVNGVSKQIERLANIFKRRDCNEVILVDDVVFSGSVISQISALFEEEDVKVVGVVTAISTEDAYVKFNKEMKYGMQCGYLMGQDVVDEICERDFYFGVAQSGMSILVNGKVYKAPYFLPFGDPIARASVPEDKAESFSKSCVNRSYLLMKKIQDDSNKTILMKDLPEPILNTNENEEVLKVLKKVM